MNADVVVVGGGPIGLATAIEARKRGVSVVVLERQRGDVDKACGEGLMPAGARWLEQNGVFGRLSSRERRSFAGIRYISESGSVVEGKLPGTGGLGVRRLALSRALRERAREVGVDLREGVNVSAVTRTTSDALVIADDLSIRCALVVAADGLHSPIRRAAEMAVERSGAQRFGMRRHFELSPWSEFVEVYFGPDAEAYVTPVGDRCVGIAFLWSARGRISFDQMLARFPQLARRVEQAATTSTIRGAGPLLQRVSRPVANRLVLIGDAAGYVDALTGEGLTLGFQSAQALGAELPEILKRHASVESFERYERTYREHFDRYALLAHSLLAVARRPTLRKALLGALSFSPGVFEAALCAATD